MKYFEAFLAVWRDLLIGDDWTVAAGVVVALVIAAGLVHAAFVPWLGLPISIAIGRGASLRRV